MEAFVRHSSSRRYFAVTGAPSSEPPSMPFHRMPAGQSRIVGQSYQHMSMRRGIHLFLSFICLFRSDALRIAASAGRQHTAASTIAAIAQDGKGHSRTGQWRAALCRFILFFARLRYSVPMVRCAQSQFRDAINVIFAHKIARTGVPGCKMPSLRHLLASRSRRHHANVKSPSGG